MPVARRAAEFWLIGTVRLDQQLSSLLVWLSKRNMIALIQRVSEAKVLVEEQTVGVISAGLLALVAIEPEDSVALVQKMARRLLAYRIFADADGKMNLSLADSGGGLLLVSQFTLAANTQKGMRPSFTTAASPELGKQRFDGLVAECRDRHPVVETGRFGAHMQVHLVNDGPATFILR